MRKIKGKNVEVRTGENRRSNCIEFGNKKLKNSSGKRVKFHLVKGMAEI